MQAVKAYYSFYLYLGFVGFVLRALKVTVDSCVCVCVLWEKCSRKNAHGVFLFFMYKT